MDPVLGTELNIPLLDDQVNILSKDNEKTDCCWCVV